MRTLLLALVLVAQVDVVRAPVRQPVTQEPTYPEDAFLVYQPDPLCAQHAIGYQLPEAHVAICHREKAIEYLIREVSEKRVIPGPAFRACDYAWSQPASWAGCVDYQIRSATPEIRWGMSPYYVVGSTGGKPYTGCVAGVSYPQFIRVNLGQPYRIMDLVTNETTNVILAYVIDRYNDSDGPIAGAAIQYANAHCPAY